jgi:hypothetical protein
MHQQRIIFESSPAFVAVCIIIALVYATVLYFRVKNPWTKLINRLLFAGRAILVFFLCFLLLGPIIRQIQNFLDKPLFVIVQDNSVSVKESVDSLVLKNIEQGLAETKAQLISKGYDVKLTTLNGDEISSFSFGSETSDLQGALKKITNRYEGSNISGVILLSDGIYNTGLSPVYSSYNFPVYTLGVGDTTQRADVAIRNVAYNKIAYQ